MDSKDRVTANELQPFRPVHPGELLKDELEYRRLSQKSVAKQLGMSYTELNEILNGKRPVTTDFALCMEAALGVSSGLLLRMQTDYNLQVARADGKLNERLAEIRKMAATPPIIMN
jgi:addiction module HigA family antidote